MTADYEITLRDRLIDGLNYLRRHALEAYQAGDGSLVLHYSALALRKCESFGKENPDQKLTMREIHWAFLLGMYFIINDWLLMLVRSALDQTDCEGESSTDRELVVMIHNMLMQPHSAGVVSDVDEIPLEWWTARCEPHSAFFDEDRLALSFLSELVWYRNPTGRAWKQLIETWIDACPQKSVMYSELIKLRNRLDFQAGIFTGEAFEDIQDTSLPIDDEIQRDLFRAWRAYYNCDWVALNAIHTRLKYRVTADHPAYVSLFYLQQISLTQRQAPDDQFIALPRLQVARSRQPAQLFQHLRDSYGSLQFLSVANAGFPKKAKASERIASLRMTMLRSLQALRTWDIGDWMSAMRDRSQSRLELGALGDSDGAIEGIIDSLRGLGVPNPKNSPRFATCLHQLDVVATDRRRACVETLLKAPPIAWRQAHTILCELSDAIPEDQFVELAEWTLKVESTDLLKNHWVHTLMDVWNEVLPRAPKREELAVHLASALRKAVASARSWDTLHATIIGAILAAPRQLAVELVDILMSTECNQDHWNRYRFSIALTVLEDRPDVGEPLLKFLRSDVEQRNDLYQRQLLKRHDLKTAGKPPERDAEFRRTIVSQFQERLGSRRNLQGPSYPIGGSSFYELSRLVSWPRSEPVLVNSIVEAIDSETVLYSDKFDYLAFLAEQVRSGPVRQARTIAPHAMRWLQGEIAGREVGPKGGGPLSNFQISMAGREELRGPLLFILEQSAIRCPEIILTTLLDWMPLSVSSHIPKFAFHFLSTALALIRAAGKKSDQDAAMLVGLADTAALLAMSSEAENVVNSFRYIVLDQLVHEFAAAELKESVWGKAFFQQWSNRLELLARHPSADVRESVATAVTRWTNSQLPHSGQMEKVRTHLGEDCRLRVRNAANS